MSILTVGLRAASATVLCFALSVAVASADDSQQCATPYADNGVAETTIVYQIDKHIAPGDFFVAMAADRDTIEYRTRAFDFFRTQFGIDIDPAGFAPGVIFDGHGGTAFSVAFQLTPGTTQQVVAIDSQEIAQLSGLFPLNNTAMIDDGYAVQTGPDGFTVYGDFGGPGGLWLPPDTVLVFGEYRMIDGDGALIDTLEYRSSIPAYQSVVPGVAPFAMAIQIRCDIRSALFGEGNTQGLGTSRFLSDGSVDMETRYIMRFPKRISEADPQNPHCDRAKALPAPIYQQHAAN